MTCKLCQTEWSAEQDIMAICADSHCSEPLGYCCERTGDAKRCDACKEWHCAKHLTRTDCGELCQECKAEYAADSTEAAA